MSRYIIDKNKLIENINIIKEKAGVEVIGVVKGNGYGFGMANLAEILMQNGIKTFAVTEVYDIPLLRETVLDNDILVMRSTCVEEEAKTIAQYDCIATIGSLSSAEVMDKVSKELGKKTKCHLKIDTGMGRYGFLPSQVESAIKCYDFENLDFCGAYTHFSSAFHNVQLTKVQLEMFKDTIKQIEKAGKSVGKLHASGRVITKDKNPLNKLGKLEAQVIETKTVPEGYSIGYNGQYKTKRETKLAIVPIGHFDGFGLEKGKEVADLHSVLSQIKQFLQKKKLTVNVNGKKYDVVGEIGLSHTAIDITGSDVKIGDVASVEISPLMVNPNIPRIFE